MTQIMQDWTRIVFDDMPIYVYKRSADWFVPNKKADAILQRKADDAQYHTLLSHLVLSHPKAYEKKENFSSSHLQEFWLHVTNKCNAKCSHCLFDSSLEQETFVSLQKIKQYIQEASLLGCKLFILSGGEPLLRVDILEIIEYILSFEKTKIVILTNGHFLKKVFSKIVVKEKKRLLFQISLDGLPYEHDLLRGKGSFEKLEPNLDWLQKEGYNFSFATCLHPLNLHNLEEFLELGASFGVKNIHFLWYLTLGRAEKNLLPHMQEVFEALIKAYQKAQKLRIVIDNFEVLKRQIFAPKGSVRDGFNAGKKSITLGFDGAFYPTAALVGRKELQMQGKSISEALESKIAKELEMQTILTLHNPLRFICGGGDLDQSFSKAKTFMGNDPYTPLREKLTLWLICNEAKRFDVEVQKPSVCLEMGDILYPNQANEGLTYTQANCSFEKQESQKSFGTNYQFLWNHFEKE